MIETTVTDDGLKNSLIVSGGLHIALMLFLYFGLPIMFKPLPIHHDPVPFEIVEISELTNTRIKEPEEQVKPPEPTPKPAARTQQVQEQAQPTPPQPDAESLSKPKPQEKPKPPETKPKNDALASVLKNVEKLKQTEASKSQEKADTQKQQEAKSLAPALSNRLTITEEDALRRQIQQCWNMPIGARDAQNLIVEVVISVNPDRTVQRADVVDKSRVASDPFFRAASEAALRALYNPRCSPLELPADKYEQWKVIDFTFDPRDML